MTQLLDLGKLRFHFAGDWLAGTVYEPNDVVKYGGNVYVYKYGLKTSGNLPTDTLYWALMVEGFQFTGVFSPTAEYRVGDGIAYGGKVYIAIADSVGQIPPNPTYWSQFVDGIQYEGAYSNVQAYQRNDVVSLGGIAYIAKVDTIGNDPTDPTYWDRFVDGISPEGVYNDATSYVIGDLVAYGSNIYRCTANSTGNLPTNSSYWAPFVYGFEYRGNWSSGSSYKIRELVTYGGSLYQAISDNNNIDPSDNPSVWDKVTYGFRNRGQWASATSYVTDDVVYHGGNTYIALEPHASTVFETDLGNGQWSKFSSGIRWRGNWTASTAYLKDDVVKDAVGSAYIAVGDHQSSAEFATDLNDGKWLTFVRGGDDVLPAIAAGDSGKSLTILPNGTDIAWIGVTASDNVYYVGPDGVDDSFHGKNLSSPYASIKYACGQAPAGSTIFVKTGSYQEQLPIIVPQGVAIVGDNQRTVLVQPAAGLSDDGVTPNAQATMFLMSDASILNKMTFAGMTGWVPDATTPEDIELSDPKGIVVALNPASPIVSKSPYVLECSAIGTGCIGAYIDGSVHASGARSMIFHGYTIISDNGVGYWATHSKAEIVSCFTYYCYFGYASTNGGHIRALNGNNSYGTWGCVSQGYDPAETPIVGAIEGRQVNAEGFSGAWTAGDTVTTPGGFSATVTNVQYSAGKIYVKNITGTVSVGDTLTSSAGGTATVATGGLEDQKGFVLVANGFASIPLPGQSLQIAGDVYSYVIQSISNTYVDSSSDMILVLAQEKPTGSPDDTAVYLRSDYSQIRLTGHDFLSIGTGGITSTNYPDEPLQQPSPGNETNQVYPGRVYYVSTDQDGNFRVGQFFRIDQATGRATLDTTAFDLSGLSSLRLGSIGAQIGEEINEFSSDVTLSGNSNQAVPTEYAVKTYIDSQNSAQTSAITTAYGTAIANYEKNWTIVTGTLNATVNSRYLLDSSGGSFTVTLPASPSTGDWVQFADAGGVLNVSSVTLARNGSKIAGAEDDLELDIRNVGFKLVYSDSTNGWRLA